MFSLGNFSAYSFYGATWRVGDLVKALCEAGFAGAGLSDMDGLYGGVEFSQACERAGLRMVLGCRLRVRDFVPGWIQVTVRERAGYTALCRVISEGHGAEIEWEGLERLQAEAGGAVWLSCPIRVEPVYRSRIGDYSRWLGAWEGLLERGWENLWLELGWQNAAGRLLQRRVFSEARRCGWERWVVMSGARHPGGERGSALLELLQSMGTLTRVGQGHPGKLPAGDYGLMNAAEVKRRFVRIPDVLHASARFAEACRFDFRYGRLFLPNPLVRNGLGAASEALDRGRQDRLLAWRCLRGLVRCYGPGYPWPEKPAREVLLERLRRELGIVTETGYAGYFLIFGEVVDECRRRDIPLLARGSAAGSLICYALGVANVCPFRFGLRFERFLNRERLRHSKLPDIDLDLPWDRRDEIISWLYERHGEDRVAMIGGFARFRGRAAVAEVAKAMGVPAHEAHAWSKRLPHGSLRRYLADREGYVEAREAWSDDRFREAVAQAADLEDLPRHPMMHPCGMVVADRSLMEFSPVSGSSKGFSMTQLSMDPIEDLGLLKMDFLGQAGLSVIRDCMANLRVEGLLEGTSEKAGGAGNPGLEEVDYADGRLYEMIRKGEARGVFHIESPAMTSLLRLCRCADIDCLVATVSVIRPGAANEDKKTAFARRYLGLEEPVYAHPVLEEVLGDSYGLMIYEEHILLVANRFAGMDFGTADLLRRILIKKTDSGALGELEAVFRSSAQRAGRGDEEIDTVWGELRDFSGFMFNKAHGAAYAVEAFHGCWLKFHWPVHFLAAVLNNRRGFYAPLVYVLEILRHGGRFELPDIRCGPDAYHVESGRVRIPIWQIRGLSERFLKAWTGTLREGPFAGWEDFVSRARPEPAEAEALARAGALRAFFKNRHEAVWRAGQVRGRRGAGPARQPELATLGRPPGEPRLPPMTGQAMAVAEAEQIGFPVTVDPFVLWMEGMDRAGTVPVSNLESHVGREVEIAGLQVCERLHRAGNGALMKFVSLADESGMAETVLFPGVYRELGRELSRSRRARLRVRVEKDETGSGLNLTVQGE